MKKKIIVLVAIVIVVAVVGLVLTNPSDQIVGKWISEDGDTILVCKNDGTFTLSVSTATEEGVWERTDPELNAYDFDFDSYSLSGSGIVSEDGLLMFLSMYGDTYSQRLTK